MAKVSVRAERIKAQMEKRLNLYIHKNELYGDSFAKTFEQYGPISALTRMRDKLDRLETLVLNPDLDSRDESIIDTLTDLANYCDMTIEVMSGPTPKSKEAKPEKKSRKTSRRKKAKEKAQAEAKEAASPLESLTKDQIYILAKDMGLVSNSRTSREVMISMLEKEFDTPEKLASYLDSMKDALK